MKSNASVIASATSAVFLAITLGCSESGNETQGERFVNSAPYTLAMNDGEVLLDRKGRTNIVKISPLSGATNLAMGTQYLPAGSGILVHKHDHTEELLYVADGTGTALLDEEFVEVTGGTTIWVPPGTWHGIENPDSDMHVIWVVTPPGLDEFMRGISWPVGGQPKMLTNEQIKEIETRYDSVTREQ